MKDLARSRSHFGSFIIDARGTILGFDQAMEELTNWPAIDVVGHGKDLNLSTRPGDRGKSPICTTPLYEGHIPMRVDEQNRELKLNCADGRRLDVETILRPLEGPGERLLVTVLGVLASSARKSSFRGAEHVDELTALPDRAAFSSRLDDDIRAATATARPLALILLDVDHLRETNDRMGHDAGDAVLRKLAGILRVTIEEECRIARLGNDDFAVLLRDAGRGEARQVAASLRSTVERFRFFTDDWKGERRPITISLGASSFPADADTADELVERAQEALDEARSMGRNRVWCYLRRPRVPVQVPVFFDGAGSPLVGYSRDLSPSGIFVQTTAGIDIGMRCALAFPLPGHDGKVHVVGRVVRTVHPETSEECSDIRVPGLGLEFERFGGAGDRRAIDSFLHENEAESLRPEDGLLSV